MTPKPPPPPTLTNHGMVAIIEAIAALRAELAALRVAITNPPGGTA